MIKNVLYKLGSLRSALAVGVAVPFLLASGASAQVGSTTDVQPAASPGTQLPESAPGPAAPPAPASQGEATTERVVVTGSYIPTAEGVTASPLDTVTTQEVRRSGSSDILQVLQKRNPDFTGGLNLGSTNANISSGATQGGSSVQLRGFPTLVLYEGRRIADAAANASGGSNFTDVGLFPAALISRIEVLKDGASALYGSEAVGGVVNIFTRSDFQGAEVGFRYGTTTSAAVAERRGYAIAGVGNETTQVTAGMQYLEMDPLFARQKEYSAISTGGTVNYSGAGRDAAGFYLPVGVDPGNFPGAPIANSPFDVGVAPGSVAPGQGFQAPQFNGYYRQVTQLEQNAFNLNAVPTSTLDTARTNAIITASHQVFGKQLELFGNFLFSNSDYESRLNAQPITLGSGLLILGSVRVNPNFVASQPISPTNQRLIPENRGNPAPFNPFQQSLDTFSNGAGAGPNRLVYANRYVDKPRIFNNQNNFYRFLGGLRSQITEDWMVETAGYYSKYDISYANQNLPILTNINQAIAGTGQYATDPLDPFALNPVGTGPGQMTAANFDSLFGTNVRQLSSFQRVFDAKVIGFPFTLPGGKVGFSLGAEYRLEGFKAVPSPEIYLGSVPIAAVNVKRSIFSQFAEVSIPITGPSMNIPGLYSLEFAAAFRHDHYEGVEEDAYVPKFSLRYQPIKDITIRSTYSASFIAPTLYETQGPNNQGFTPSINLGAGTEQAQVLSGSNPNLAPSTAETYTAGIVYSPSFVPGLTVSADFFRVLQVNIIGTIGSATILTDVNNRGPGSPFAQFVAFNAFPGQSGAQPVTAAGQLAGNLTSTFVTTANQNLGGQYAEGWDLAANYNLDLRTFGQLELGVNALVITNYDAKDFPTGSERYNLRGLVGSEGFGVFPDYKFTTFVEYRWSGLSLSLIGNYIPEVKSAVGEDVTGDQSAFLPVEDFFTVDGRLSYTFEGRKTAGAAVAQDYSKGGKNAMSKGGGEAVAGAETMSPVQKLLDGLTLAVGCNNMFDQDPPLVIGANSNTVLSVYDPFGQFFYFEVSKKF